MNNLASILQFGRKKRNYTAFVMTKEQWKSFHDRPILLMKEQGVEKSPLSEIAQRALNYAQALGYNSPDIEDGLFHMLEYLESVYGKKKIAEAEIIAFDALIMYRDLCGADVVYLAEQYGFAKLDVFIGALIESVMGLGQEGIFSQYLRDLNIAPTSEMIELPDTLFAARGKRKFSLNNPEDQQSLAHIHAMARLSGKGKAVEQALDTANTVEMFAEQIGTMDFGKYTRIHYLYFVHKYRPERVMAGEPLPKPSSTPAAGDRGTPDAAIAAQPVETPIGVTETTVMSNPLIAIIGIPAATEDEE